jgi:nitrite reductase/ring-hydroxylating ferredoxin subunit
MVVRGDIDARDFVVFYLKDDAVVGAFGMDRGGDVMAAKALIAARRSPGDAILANPDARPRPMCLKRKKDPKRKVGQGPTTGFERVARSGQVTEGIVRRFMVGDLELAIARSDGQAYALHNICTHLACKLAAGQVEGGALTCLCHGSIFELATGIPLNPPATVPVRTFPVIERDGLIYVKVR